MTVTLSANSVQ